MFEFAKVKIDSPIVWMGGKKQLLPEIEKNLPPKYNDYYEVFAGGCAVLFYLQPERAFVNDINSELITTYKCIQDKEMVGKLIDRLNHLSAEYNKSEEKRDMYYSMINGTSDDPLEIASRFLFLNKTAFSGMYRVNHDGKFNSSWGQKELVNMYDSENITRVHKYLNRHVSFTNGSYEEIIKQTKTGDLVYFDPPYDPINNSGATCSDYTATGFSKHDQEVLADHFKELTDRGVYCLLSNHNTELIEYLYKDYTIVVVSAKRSMNCKEKMRMVEEVLVKNY